MTRFREVQYHEIPDAYARQTLALAEARYGYDGPDPEAVAYWAEVEEAEAREEWQNERAASADRYVSYQDVAAPHVMQILAAGGHVYHVSPGCED